MTDNCKRKDEPDGPQRQQNKKKKTGNSGKWMTTHQKANIALAQSQSVQAGDAGIWVTCARNQEGKALRELCTLFDEYVSLMYGIEQVDKDEGGGDDGDVESAVQRQIDALKSEGPTSDRIFTALKMNVACLIFVKTKPPIEPVELVRRICQDAKACTNVRKMKCRYVNRFSPSSFGGKANEAAIADLARKALAPFFDLSRVTIKAEGTTVSVDNDLDDSSKLPSKDAAHEKAQQADEGLDRKDYSYAIRPTIRNNTNIGRGRVIEIIADLINGRHRVKLNAPDKVILVDIFQNVCGVSVVDGDWEDLKRYNITELYNESTGKNSKG